MKRDRVREEDLAKAVIVYLRGLGWKTYNEVSFGTGSKRADIVAEKNGLVWIVECKVRLSYDVIEQVLGWRGSAHYLSVAARIRSRSNELIDHLLEYYGIGYIPIENQTVKYPNLETGRIDFNSENGVKCDHPDHKSPRILSRSRFHHEFIRRLILSRLTEDLNQYPAGNARSEFWSPFRETRRNVIDFVRKNPGCTLKELSANIDHHYGNNAAAKSALYGWITKGVISEVELKRAGKLVRLYLKIRGDTQDETEKRANSLRDLGFEIKPVD